jgi:hypothetical protein
VSRSSRFGARFDEELFAEDLAHATDAGREVGLAERARIEREGISPSDLIACEPEARDGTRLPGCVKTYLPQPDGDWGMVFAGDVDQVRGELVLVCLAFGRRHPTQPWRPSVYQVAHRRLNG